jgi:4-hydroxy-3-methylbut-2-enyl diphosphate reductase
VKVILAERIGFCFGVKRAVQMAGSALKSGRKICSLGSIIHNAQVVDDLSKRGLRVIKDIGPRPGGYEAVVISSHGIGPKEAERIAKKGIGIIDTTCPFVLKAQMIARSLREGGFDAVIIVGDSNHPEVRALVDFAPKGAMVTADAAQAARLRIGPGSRIAVLSQTTQSAANFREVLRRLSEKRPKELKVYDTICNDAGERQRSARELASRVDAMFVIGGRHSANTRRLYEVCKSVLRNSHLIETERDIKAVWLKRVGSLGIASGASTPDWMVKRVVNRVKCKIQNEKRKTKI